MSESNNPERKVTLLSATLICVTCIIGSGWLFSAQLNAKMSGNYAFAAWWVAAAFAIMVGFSFIPIVRAFPVRGATAKCTTLSHNALFGLPFAFANWFGILVVIATEAQASTQYIAGVFERDILTDGMGHLSVEGKLLASAILVLYLLVNYFGVKLLVRLNNPLTILKMATPILLVVVLLASHFDSSNFHLASNSKYHWSSIEGSILGAGLVYAFNGFQMGFAFANDIKNPNRNLWLSMVLAIIISAIIMTGVQFAFMGAVPHDMIAQNGWTDLNFSSPLVQLSILLGLNVMSIILLADSVVSPSATGYVYLGASSRMLYAMSKSHQMPGIFSSKIHPKFNLCRRSMGITFALTLITLWCADSWSALMLVVSAYHVISYLSGPISMGAISPKKRPLGLIVFLVITFLMTTLNMVTLSITAWSLTILILIYLVVNRNKNSLKDVIYFTFPFGIYIWTLYFQGYFQLPWWIALIVAACIYVFITSSSFVQRCHSKRTSEDLVVDMPELAH